MAKIKAIQGGHDEIIGDDFTYDAANRERESIKKKSQRLLKNSYDYVAKSLNETGKRETISVTTIKDKKLAKHLWEMQTTEKKRERAETRRHLRYFEGSTELIMLEFSINYNGRFLTPEEAYFHKLWIIEHEQQLQTLRNALRKLDKEQRDLIKMRFYKNMEISDIAKILNRDASVIRKRIKNVLKILRQEF